MKCATKKKRVRKWGGKNISEQKRENIILEGKQEQGLAIVVVVVVVVMDNISSDSSSG